MHHKNPVDKLYQEPNTQPQALTNMNQPNQCHLPKTTCARPKGCHEEYHSAIQK